MATHIQAGAMVNGLMGVVGIQNAEEKADQEALNELDNFAADPELMRRRMEAYIESTHPRVATPGEEQKCCCRTRKTMLREKHSICYTSTGSHAFVGGKDDKGELEAYGVGISLYFKYLKYLTVVYFVLTVLAVPALVIYSLGGKLSDVETSIQYLPETTLGNLGESKIACQSTNDDFDMAISCPEGAIIGRIQAYYGQPAGACDCPTSRVPDPTCAPQASTTSCSVPGEACFFSNIREVRLPNDETFTTSSCCAKQLDSDGIPDFSELDIKVTPGCDAPNAERIVKGLCAGKQECTLRVSPDNNYTWVPNAQYGTYCKDQTSVQTVNGSVVQCNEGLASYGGLDSCAGGQYAVHRLIVVAQCFDTHLDINGKLVSKQSLVELIGVMDFFQCAFVVLAWLYLRRKETKAAKDNDFNTATASDYTVMVRTHHKYYDSKLLDGLLRDHFKELLGHDAVADINFGFNNSMAIDTLRLRGEFMLKLDRINRLILADMNKKHMELPAELRRNTFKAHAKKLKLLASYERVLARLDALTANLRARAQAKERYVVVSFVTFKTELDQIAVLEQYPKDWVSRRCLCCQKTEKRLEGRYPVKCEQAPEPSDVIWENLATSAFGRCWRKAITTVLVMAALFITLVLVFISQSVKQENLREFPAADCSLMNDVSNQTLVVQDVLWEKYNQTVGNTGRLECFCKNLFLTGDVTGVLDVTFPEPDLAGEVNWCVTWMETFVTNSLLTYGGVVFVLGVNIAMRALLKRVTAFERHKSRTEEVVSLGTQLFFTQLINTGFVYLLVNTHFSTDVEWLAIGSYTDFSASWFSTVGVSIMVTMGLNIVFPHLTPIMRLCLDSCKRRWDRTCLKPGRVTKKKTQAAYNKLYSQQTFRFAERYGQSLNTFVVTLCYSTGLPLLLPFALVGTMVSFWMDKVFLLRFSKTPIAFNDGMAKRATQIMPFGLLLHMGFGIWMLGNTNIVADEALEAALLRTADEAGQAGAFAKDQIDAFDPGLNASTRLFANHVLPLTVLFFILAALFVLWVVVYKPCHFAWSCLACCHDDHKDEGLRPYFDAIPIEGLISSLSRGGVKDTNAAEYVRAAEIHLFHHVTDEQLASNDKMTLEQAQRIGYDEVQQFRKNLREGATIGSAVRASLRHDDDGTAVVDVRNADEAAPDVDMSFEELAATERPDPLKLMPPHQHSYHIQEVMEYHDAFALDSYVAEELKVGLDGRPMSHHNHKKVQASIGRVRQMVHGRGHSRGHSDDLGGRRVVSPDAKASPRPSPRSSPRPSSSPPGIAENAPAPMMTRSSGAHRTVLDMPPRGARGVQPPPVPLQQQLQQQAVGFSYDPNIIYYPPGCPPGQDPRQFFSQAQVQDYNHQLRLNYARMMQQQQLRTR